MDQGADSATVDESRLGQVDDHIRARGDDGVERGSERGNGGKVVFAEQRDQRYTGHRVGRGEAGAPFASVAGTRRSSTRGK